MWLFSAAQHPAVSVSLTTENAKESRSLDSSFRGVPRIKWTLLMSVRHDPSCFTQGLTFFSPRQLIQSCGLYGQSSLQKLNMDLVHNKIADAPVVEHVVRGKPTDFFEGSTVANNTLYVLTWKQRELLQLPLPAMNRERRIHFPYDGWGLAYDAKRHVFFATNGSDKLIHFTLDEKNSTAVVIKRFLSLRCDGRPLHNVNELEYDGTYLYGNVWYSSEIFIIDPYSGNCVAFIDATPLLEPRDVLNGIALIEDTSFLDMPSSSDRVHLWVTGKLWTKMHLLQLDFRYKQNSIN